MISTNYIICSINPIITGIFPVLLGFCFNALQLWTVGPDTPDKLHRRNDWFSIPSTVGNFWETRVSQIPLFKTLCFISIFYFSFFFCIKVSLTRRQENFVVIMSLRANVQLSSLQGFPLIWNCQDIKIRERQLLCFFSLMKFK